MLDGLAYRQIYTSLHNKLNTYICNKASYYICTDLRSDNYEIVLQIKCLKVSCWKHEYEQS